MGVIALELRCPQNVNGIAADPEPDWSFDNLLSELNSIEKKLTINSDIPASLTKKQPRKLCASKENNSYARGFVMHVSDHEMDDSDSDSEENADETSIVPARRFAYDELSMSDDDSENGSPLGMQCRLMEKVGLAEGALCELSHELQLSVSDEVRNKISALETELIDESKQFASRIAKVEKYRESLLEKERKLDLQYRRTIAEALDNHLTAVQRDHAQISQLEERRIRDDAAREEAKRKEKMLREDKIQQERAKAEEEMRLKAEMAKAAAVKAEKQAAEEEAAKRAAEASKVALMQSTSVGVDSKKELQSSGKPVATKNVIKASVNALELEKRRRQIYDELSAKNNALKSSNSQGYKRHGNNINRRIQTISATQENIITKVNELLNLINDPVLPQSIGVVLFAEKIVSNCKKSKSSNAIFATGRVIVHVTSKIPEAMNVLIAELNKACIYTVPKHIIYSEAAFKTKDDHYKTIGYEEEDGKIEDTSDYLEKVSSYMKLYGAIVQTEVGVQNPHGLEEGWAWLARFLNALPSNHYTAVALYSFLEMAGFALYRRYKNQFEKLLKIIVRDFVNALKEGTSKTQIMSYIESNQYKKEPEGLKLSDHLNSKDFY